ncbi:unnamed protein product [Ilex paraguariensis]|uniref:Uncharacterized protein n=1 Tax=Ilex paraguariensis TaxID=185542 RepID=A0ABC8SGW4_9AQUA
MDYKTENTNSHLQSPNSMASGPAVLSSSLAPGFSEKDELLFSNGRNYALLGEITMLVLLLLFTFFIISIVCFLRIKLSPDASKLSPLDQNMSKDSLFHV